MSGILVLEDGTVFQGKSVTKKSGVVIAPIFFDTRVVGYQEVITDPANCGKILIFTYPLIGNYGINKKFDQSEKSRISGLVIKENSRIYSNWQAEDSLDYFLTTNGLIAISEVDTRTLAVHLRENGQMWAAISANGKNIKNLLTQINNQKKKSKPDYIRKISIDRITEINAKAKTRRIGVLDLGVCNGLINQLIKLDCNPVLLPHNSKADEILKLKLDGLIISSGPEEDIALDDVVAQVKKLIGKTPILGIALGHQIICRAIGAKTAKMKIGHHGVNYPIVSPGSNKGAISVQNHDLVVDKASLTRIRKIKISAVNLNDGSVEGIESVKDKLIGTQYYLTSPGFEEVHPVLNKFIQSCR